MRHHLPLLYSLLLLLVLTSACDSSVEPRKTVLPEPFPMTAQEPMRDVDLVFVIDTSLSMMEEQVILRQNFPQLMDQLKNITGGLPNLHLGVITPDLGAAPYELPGCTGSGQEGLFQKGENNSCMNPSQHHYVIDVEPRGCTIDKVHIGDQISCPYNDCTQLHCDRDAFSDGQGGFLEPDGLTLTMDDNGCPRCRNFTDETLEEVFSCVADVGSNGCGFEQPLEALHRALTSTSPYNQGFLREDAYLAVVFITDEDDCSVEDTELFNPEGDIASPLGVMNSFRCTEFGVVCDAEWDRNLPNGFATYTNCVARPDGDPKRMLQPLDRYTGLLATIKNPSKIIATAVAGLTDGTVILSQDPYQNPEIQNVCSNEGQFGGPAVRLLEFIDSFYDATPEWAKTSICESDFSPALVGLGRRLASVVGTQCLSTVAAGCMDPAAAFGGEPLTELPQDVAGVCSPVCSVEQHDPEDQTSTIPACDPGYQGGHPATVDAGLPVEACWHVMFNANCSMPCPEGSLEQGCDPVSNPWNYPSRGAELVVSRRAPPSEGLRIQATCSSYELTETVCDDGLDNDADGRLDASDPDCQSQK
ncbi:MAG: hypothetical protein CVU59_00080 [Deltaproteobacteria bacterium HGW-Deltaproteobacteria-17]|nr:MAG: hypothetical protein CVU59_00080 [Deltaproteobacteria bacterium HGW-Deltaproteobacteria-17]